MGLQVKADDGGATERFTKELHTDLKFEEIDVMTAIECGFKQTWLDGSGGGYDSIVLTSGAGCGSPWGQLSLEKDGETRHFRFNAQELLESMIRSVVESDDG